MSESANYDIIAKENIDLGDPPKDHQGPQLLRVAKEHWGPNFYIHRPTMRPAMIILIRSGSMVIGDGLSDEPGQETTVGPGTVLVYHGETSRHQVVNDADGCRLSVVCCDGAQLNPLLQEHLGGPALYIPEAMSTQVLFEEIYHSASRAGPQVHALCGHLVQALVLRLSEIQQLDHGSISKSQQQFLIYRRTLWQHAEELASVSEFAQLCGVSQAHLTRLFQRYDQETPATMLRRFRLRRVRELLENTHQTIAQIADDLHFGDPYTMSRAFKRHYGYSPSTIRQP